MELQRHGSEPSDNVERMSSAGDVLQQAVRVRSFAGVKRGSLCPPYPDSSAPRLALPHSTPSSALSTKIFVASTLLARFSSTRQAAATITYTDRQFRRSEKKTADPLVRPFYRDRRQRAQSEPVSTWARTNVSTSRSSLCRSSRRCGYPSSSGCRNRSKPVREGFAYSAFSDEDLTFLREETVR